MLTFSLIFLLILSAIYYKLIVPLLYWKKRNVFYVTPWHRLYQVFFSKKAIPETIIDIYKEYPDKRFYGSYQFLKPSIFVRDLDLIKQITVKDFEHFTDHQLLTSESSDAVLALNLFSLKGQKWREMRSALSPAFTGSKMKLMFGLISEIADNRVEYLLNSEEDIIKLEMRDFYSRYTNDVIASCAFGIHINSQIDPNNEFYRRGKFFTEASVMRLLNQLFIAFFPKIAEFFNIPVLEKDITDFFLKLVKDSIKHREENNITRPDLIHLLIEARKGRLNPESNCAIEISDEVITAQAIVFFIAGFTTSSSLLSLLSYELATNPDIMAKLQHEIDSVSDYSYESIAKMKYLEQVILEALRKYPPGYILNRVCVKDFKIEPINENESAVIIEKGCLVGIPAIGLHYCEDYFKNPNKFDPDRFSEENKAKIPGGVYMPFGAGPRNCIGSRFALLETKVLIFKLLKNFDIVPIEKTVIPLQLAKTLEITVKGGNWLGFKKRL